MRGERMREEEGEQKEELENKKVIKESTKECKGAREEEGTIRGGRNRVGKDKEEDKQVIKERMKERREKEGYGEGGRERDRQHSDIRV